MYYFLQEQIDSARERFAIRIQAHSMHPYRNPLSLHKMCIRDSYGPAYLTALGTMSSAATLGIALECARKSPIPVSYTHLDVYKRQAIIGANILQQGTTNGTITDIDGNFTLEVPTDAQLADVYKRQVHNLSTA